VSPGHSLNLQSVGRKSEASHAAYNVSKIKNFLKHVSRKGFVLSMTLNCGWEDLSSKVPSSTRTGGNGGGFFARETTFLNSRLGCILCA